VLAPCGAGRPPCSPRPFFQPILLCCCSLSLGKQPLFPTPSARGLSGSTCSAESRCRPCTLAQETLPHEFGTVDKLATAELLPAWSGGIVGHHPSLNGAVMALSSSPDSGSFQQLSVHGSPSPIDQSQDAPRKLAVLGLPWDTRWAQGS
jgi:hypothetical protein